MLSVQNSLMSSKFCTGNIIPGSGCAFSKPWQSSNSKITHQENEKLDSNQALETCIYCFCTSEDKKGLFILAFIVEAPRNSNFLLLIDYFF